MKEQNSSYTILIIVNYILNTVTLLHFLKKKKKEKLVNQISYNIISHNIISHKYEGIYERKLSSMRINRAI